MTSSTFASLLYISMIFLMLFSCFMSGSGSIMILNYLPKLTDSLTLKLATCLPYIDWMQKCTIVVDLIIIQVFCKLLYMKHYHQLNNKGVFSSIKSVSNKRWFELRLGTRKQISLSVLISDKISLKILSH